MFGRFSYLGYTILFTVPPLLLFWLRKKFFAILAENLKAILISTAIITLYASAIWPIALHIKAWEYGEEKILNIKFFNFVFLEDVVWWFSISFLFASFISIAIYYEKQGADIVLKEVKGLFRSFINAFAGLRAFSFERNLTIHAAMSFCVVFLGLAMRITLVEWLFIITAIGFVLAAELFNSAIERLASKYTKERDEDIRFVKDVSAAAVLSASAVAALIGISIFLRRFIEHI